METIIALKNVDALRELLPPGGYIAEITGFRNVTDKEYLELDFDIVDGRFSGFYGGAFGQKMPFSHKIIKAYREGFFESFAQFLNILEQSNPNSNCINAGTEGLQRTQFVGKRIGLMISLEQYIDHNGDFKTRNCITSIVPVNEIDSSSYYSPRRSMKVN